ncbi:MAG: CoA-binding protein, partial [Thermodesulfobacteriota bacterium]
PGYDEILGEKCYKSLLDIPDPVDIVDIFRRSKDVPPIVEDAIEIGAKVVWMQLTVVNEEAAQRARDAGLEVVMNRCVKIEYGRIFGGINYLGVNRRLISSKKP